MFEIFIAFLRIGLVGFGGPIALVSIIENEVCQNKKWLTLDDFSEIFSICKLLPGPLAVQVAICCGYKKGGRIGGFLAGFGFLLPALIMIIVLGIFYTHNLNTHLTRLRHVFEYMQDATIAVIIITLVSLAKLYVKNITSFILVIIATIFVWFNPSFEPIIIIVCGLIGLIVYKISARELSGFPVLFGLPNIFSNLSLGNLVYGKLVQLFWVCIKAGEFSFGTGLAIIPLLHSDIVVTHQWLTNQQFIDGITLGQITPGPTTISIIFFGFVIAGFKGLIVSLLGFYIPPMFNSLVLIPLFWKKMANSHGLKIFTNWAFPAVIGGILSAVIKIGIASIGSVIDLVIILFSLVLLYKKFILVWGLIPLCGLVGLGVSYL